MTYDSGDKDLGAIVKKHRIRAKKSVRRLAREIGRDHSMLLRVETGERGVNVNMLARLCLALGPLFLFEYMQVALTKVEEHPVDPDESRPPVAASQPKVQKHARHPASNTGGDGKATGVFENALRGFVAQQSRSLRYQDGILIPLDVVGRGRPTETGDGLCLPGDAGEI